MSVSMSLEVKGSQEVQRMLQETAAKLGNLQAPLRKSGVYMLGSINRNFQAQGRPSKWADLSEMTKNIRRYYKHWPGKILQVLGELKASITMQVTKNDCKIGTSLPKAGILQFGGTTTFKGRTATIPARPFVMFQVEDHNRIDEFFKEHGAKSTA